METKESKKWCFEERHAAIFSSWECVNCHYPNRGSKVTPLYLNDWQQRRLICVSCKKERTGHWRCTHGHVNVLEPARNQVEPLSAHMCGTPGCNEETRAVLVEYTDGHFFEKEEEEGWAASLIQL